MAEGTQHRENPSIHIPIDAQLDILQRERSRSVEGAMMTCPTETQEKEEETLDCNCDQVGVMTLPGLMERVVKLEDQMESLQWDVRSSITCQV